MRKVLVILIIGIAIAIVVTIAAPPGTGRLRLSGDAQNLLADLQVPGSDISIRNAAAGKLGKQPFHPDIVEGLLAALTDQEVFFDVETHLRTSVACAAAQSLTMQLTLYPSETVTLRPRILEAFDMVIEQGDFYSAEGVLAAMETLPDGDVVPRLLSIASDKEKDLRMRVAAVYDLGERQDRSAVPAILEILDDEDRYLASFAAEALGRIGDTRAVLPLART